MPILSFNAFEIFMMILLEKVGTFWQFKRLYWQLDFGIIEVNFPIL